MKELNLQTTIHVYQEKELNEIQRKLLVQAKAAASKAYAPYSKFHVGAAVLLEDGTMVIGSNQENAAYPSGLCAERTALFSAGAQYPHLAPTMLAIVAGNAEGEYVTIPAAPCGGCRQVLIEVEQRYGRPMQVLLYGTTGVYVIESAMALLPLSFTQADLLQANAD